MKIATLFEVATLELVSEQTKKFGTEKINPAPEVEIKRGRSALGTGL